MFKAVLDIETIPLPKERIKDYKANFEPKTEKKTKAKKKSVLGGLHFLTGRPICVGIKPLGRDPVVFCDEDESIIFAGLVEYLRDHQPLYLITYNGKEFDLPLLRMRALLYGYDLAQYLPFGKYVKNHYDIYQELGGKWGMSAKLAELAWHFGIPDIYESGANISDMYDEGDLEGIIAHNIGDLLVTEALYKKLNPTG